MNDILERKSLQIKDERFVREEDVRPWRDGWVLKTHLTPASPYFDLLMEGKRELESAGKRVKATKKIKLYLAALPSIEEDGDGEMDYED